VEVGLSEEGLVHIDEVVAVVFQYIRLLQAAKARLPPRALSGAWSAHSAADGAHRTARVQTLLPTMRARRSSPHGVCARPLLARLMLRRMHRAAVAARATRVCAAVQSSPVQEWFWHESKTMADLAFRFLEVRPAARSPRHAAVRCGTSQMIGGVA
jgi:hypothetical protein